MDIQQAHINSIHPYANNPRNNETAIRKVAESIEQFGQGGDDEQQEP
jgi:hypothetical protein